jgi:glycosyltransferase involved in cell wall biosynthesis
MRIDSKSVVLLPAFNEELTVASTIQEIRTRAPNSLIVVIDNNSSDDTKKVALEQGAIVIEERRRGKGFAVQLGFDFALSSDFDVIILMDADATYGADQILPAIDMVTGDGVDMVVGKRVPRKRSDESDEGSHFRFGHKLGNKLFTQIAKLLLPAGIDDVLSGWRVMSRPFVQSFPGGSKGFEIEAQLNSHAFSLRSLVRNVEVDYFARPSGSSSKLNTYQDGLRILRTTMKNFRGERPFMAFSILALPWLVATVALCYLPFRTYLDTGLVPYLPRLVAGVGTFLIACLLWSAGIVLERIKEMKVQISLAKYQKERISSFGRP